MRNNQNYTYEYKLIVPQHFNHNVIIKIYHFLDAPMCSHYKTESCQSFKRFCCILIIKLKYTYYNF